MAQQLITPIETQLREISGLDCYGANGQTLASVVGELLQEHQATLSVAESCTGGGLGQILTQIPGSSEYFLGGVIAYHNQVKTAILQVNPDDLAEHGAVSAVVAEQMALGVKNLLQTTWGLSITGIAGPGGGTAAKPVGLVYIGLATPQGSVESLECRFGEKRGRDWIRRVSASTALDLLRRHLLGQG